jgi:hypothetical protein
VDTTETQNRQGSRDKAPGDNVVQLPRDWLGPREDLVPFGPSAHRDAPAPVTELPRSADDFWGGGADLQDLTAPTETVSAAPARRWSLPRLSVPRLSLPGPARPNLSLPRVRVGARAALLFGLGALAILAAVGFVLGSAARKPSTPLPRAAASPGSSTLASSFDARAAARLDTLAQDASRARARRAASARHRAEVRARRTRESGRRHRHHRTAPAVQTVHNTTAAPAPISNTASVSQTDDAQASSSPPTASSPSPTTASSASTAGGSSSSNQPALGANGSLSPGSSPDG